MLKLNSLTKRFGNFTAVDNISLELNKGELFGFLGPNGAGKTTTIKMITGLIKPSAGKIDINGFDLAAETIEAKSIIGYIPDQPFIYDRLTGKEFLFFSGSLYGIEKNTLKERIDNVIDQLKIGSWINKNTEDYSQGMKQRIVIASAFLHEPDLILVDEPMIGLDPQSAHIIKNVFKKYTDNGKTIFMSTHSLHVVEEICGRVGIINKGKMIFDDSIAELLKLKNEKDRNLEELFIELTEDEPDFSNN